MTLYVTAPNAPTQLARGKTDENGAFNLNVDQTPADRVLYLVAKGGTPQAAADKGPNDAIALMAVLGTELPKTVTAKAKSFAGWGGGGCEMSEPRARDLPAKGFKRLHRSYLSAMSRPAPPYDTPVTRGHLARSERPFHSPRGVLGISVKRSNFPGSVARPSSRTVCQNCSNNSLCNS